jgi:hypothetical protein
MNLVHCGDMFTDTATSSNMDPPITSKSDSKTINVTEGSPAVPATGATKNYLMDPADQIVSFQPKKWTSYPYLREIPPESSGSSSINAYTINSVIDNSTLKFRHEEIEKSCLVAPSTCCFASAPRIRF